MTSQLDRIKVSETVSMSYHDVAEALVSGELP
jgi:hypothetical protein